MQAKDANECHFTTKKPFPLKPFIDSVYSTKTDPQNTSIMGSSISCLISAFAVCEYPKVFDAAGCVSTHWPALEGAFLNYLKTNLPDPAKTKFYFDYGTETLDAMYEPFQTEADKIMGANGFIRGESFTSK